MRITSLLITITFCSCSFADSTTLSRTISRIELNGDDTYYYFLSEEGNWGAQGCENATYVYIKSQDNLISKEILSAALAAKVAKNKVRFRGTCDSDENYMQAKTILVD